MQTNSEGSESDDTEETRPNILKRIEGHIQSKTLAGLLDLVPVLVTVIVVLFLVERTDALIRPLPFVANEPWDFPGIGLIVGIIVFYLVGIVISTSFGMRLSAFKNALISHIPVIKAIFGVTQQVMTSFTSQYSFSRVVFLVWPREGMIAMGFVTGRAYSARTQDSIAIVYIPTIPNPTSGNMALVLEDDLVETDLAVDDAMKLVFSGGIVLPDSLSLARVPREKSEQFELIGRFESTPTCSSDGQDSNGWIKLLTQRFPESGSGWNPHHRRANFIDRFIRMSYLINERLTCLRTLCCVPRIPAFQGDYPDDYSPSGRHRCARRPETTFSRRTVTGSAGSPRHYHLRYN